MADVLYFVETRAPFDMGHPAGPWHVVLKTRDLDEAIARYHVEQARQWNEAQITVMPQRKPEGT